MSRLTVLIGLPGSGKSTIAKEYGQVVSTDAIRKELLGNEEDQRNGNLIFEEAYRRIHQLLRDNQDVVFDATNISKRNRVLLVKEFMGADEINAVFVNTPLSTCIERNNSRERKVPLEVITRMHKTLTPPSIEEGFTNVTVLM